METETLMQVEEERPATPPENNDLQLHDQHDESTASDQKEESQDSSQSDLPANDIKEEKVQEDNEADEDPASSNADIKDEIKSEPDQTSQQSSVNEDAGLNVKSESQTSVNNTSSSPSESQSSSGSNILTDIPLRHNPSVVIVPLKSVTNGTIPKSGKPFMSAINPKLNKPRGRPKRSKALVAMYQSEISDNKVGIKLCIKKSDTSQSKSKPSRKRSRKSKHRINTDSDDSEYEKRRRKEKSNNNTDKHKKTERDYKEPEKQGVWGEALPENVLYKVFQYLVQQEGCLPTLYRVGRVCSLWRNVSLYPSLWTSLDLSTWIKEKYHTEDKLKWFISNRLSKCKELNVSTWKIGDVQCVLEKLADACPDLVGINLSGWKGLTSDNLIYLVENLKKLERLDLSSINIEMNSNKSAVGLQSLCNAIQVIDGRLTHLHLAHNRLAGIPQIVKTLSTYCPNLMLLDLSNVRTIAVSHAVLHVEMLQQGCQKLKILRITNSHMTLSSASLQEQMDSPGFPELEELSVASLANESRTINDEFLQRILKQSTKLKLLDVRGCARLTHDSLIRLPAWDLKHLFLSGCSVTRDFGSGLELIASKWAHSLIEFDLAWANVQEPLDNALRAIAEKGAESALMHLNLCGSSVSEDAVKEILANCPNLNSINLASCRGLPRGVKRLIQGPTEIQELRDVLKVTLKVMPPVKSEEKMTSD
ncbi:unnamed protein product [Hermetia illucens]|uniref:F-box domain-containing protein n=1 Tax=Hermetia illucens TaxID=343691 RepID=A0A7R8YLP8_HERIL|nr:F-box/LRR-repeat protein 6 [Hermetia illucens]CAD7077383.1 unnamed protein product [Hermetia illucens]